MEICYSKIYLTLSILDVFFFFFQMAIMSDCLKDKNKIMTSSSMSALHYAFDE